MDKFHHFFLYECNTIGKYYRIAVRMQHSGQVISYSCAKVTKRASYIVFMHQCNNKETFRISASLQNSG